MVMPKKILGNRVLVQYRKPEDKTVGGIIIPQTASVAWTHAIVLAMGDLVINLSVGDQVIYPAGAGIDADIIGQQCAFIDGPMKDSPGHIIAII